MALTCIVNIPHRTTNSKKSTVYLVYEWNLHIHDGTVSVECSIMSDFVHLHALIDYVIKNNCHQDT